MFQRLTDHAFQKVIELSRRYGVSVDAVQALLQAVANGGGTMAQFSHNDLGGSGQWMQGGMTMVGDMFNNGLKYTVDGLCRELSQLLREQPFAPPEPPTGGSYSSGSFSGGSSQSQWQGGGSSFGSSFGGYGDWWPGDLGRPNASGGQNNVRYAYFAGPRRLAVDVGGNVAVYDTLDHQIGGVSQQQGGGSSLTFSSQYGTVELWRLPLVSGAAPAAPPPPPPAWQPTVPPPTPVDAQESDVFAKLERLAELKARGIVTEEEFAAKKAELLSRL
ncbi:MAG: SHOCT domain-containing protein [Planctomycetia bacterium]